MADRFTTIPKNEITDIEGLKNALTIKNPAYSYQKDKLGIRESRIQVPKVFQLFNDGPNESLVVPRSALHDPNVAQYTNAWSTYMPPDIPKTKDPLWNPKCKLYQHQKPAVDDILNNKADMIIAECGSGKTTMSISVIAHSELPVIIVVNQTLLAKQWKEEILRFTTLTDKEIRLHKNTSMKLSLKAKVVIATIQSLVKLPYTDYKTFFDSFKLAIFDEVHSTGSMEFQKAISKFECKRVGVTATPKRTDGFKTFKWAIGMRETYAHAPDKLVPTIIPFKFDADEYITENDYLISTRNGKELNLPMLINKLVSISQRNQLILQILNQMTELSSRKCVVLTHRRKHAEEIYDKLKTKDKMLLLGGNKEVIDKNKAPRVLVATFHLLRQAFDMPALDTMILVTPFAAANDAEQTVGRILRNSEGKQTPLVIDIYDTFTEKKSPAEILAERRMKTYKNKDYNILSLESPITSTHELIQYI